MERTPEARAVENILRPVHGKIDGSRLWRSLALESWCVESASSGSFLNSAGLIPGIGQTPRRRVSRPADSFRIAYSRPSAGFLSRGASWTSNPWGTQAVDQDLDPRSLIGGNDVILAVNPLDAAE